MRELNEIEMTYVSGGLDWKGEALINTEFIVIGSLGLGFVGLTIGKGIDMIFSTGLVELSFSGARGGVIGFVLGSIIGLGGASLCASYLLNEMRNSDQI